MMRYTFSFIKASFNLQMVYDKKLTPTNQAITSILTSYFYCAEKDQRVRQKYFERAIELFESLPKPPSVIHLNAMIRVCSACAEEGGWDYGLKLYDEYVSEQTICDHITYTNILHLCSRNSNQDGYIVGSRIWREFLGLRRQEISEHEQKGGVANAEFLKSMKFKLDATVIQSFLRICIRVKSWKDAQAGLIVLRENLGLPMKGDPEGQNWEFEEYKRRVESGEIIHMNEILADCVLRLAARFRDQEYQKHIRTIIFETIGVRMDDLLRGTTIRDLCIAGQFDTALEFAKDANRDLYSTKNYIRLSAMVLSKAAHHHLRQRDDRMKRNEQFQPFIPVMVSLVEEVVAGEASSMVLNGADLHYFTAVLSKCDSLSQDMVKFLKHIPIRGQLIDKSESEFDRVIDHCEMLLATEDAEFLNMRESSIEPVYKHKEDLKHRVAALRNVKYWCDTTLELKRHVEFAERLQAFTTRILGKYEQSEKLMETVRGRMHSLMTRHDSKSTE